MSKRKLIRKLKSAFTVGVTAAMVTTGVFAVTPFMVNAADYGQTTTYSSSEKRNVMYYGDWSIWGGQGNFYPQDLPADQLTHLNFAFLDFDAQGNLIFCDKDAAVSASLGQEGVTWGGVNGGILPALVNLRAANPNMKLGVSIGGWSKSRDFTPVAADPVIRAKFVANVMKFIEYTNMDFVDLDWEYPTSVREPDRVDNTNDEGTPLSTPEDKNNYILLLQDLRAALDEQGARIGKTYELTVALPASRNQLRSGIDVERLFNVVDFANIMTYDMRGAWDEYSGHQTNLYPNPADPYAASQFSVDETVSYLIEEGAEPNKIVVGAAFYTRGWEEVDEGDNPELPGLFGYAHQSALDADQSPSRGALNEAPMKVGEGGRRGGVWSYRSLDALKAKYGGLEYYWDDVAKAPYLYSKTTKAFFTYDDVRSVTEKANYVNDKALGGVISWMASQDKESVAGSKVRDELTKAIKQGLFGDAALPEHEVVYADLDIQTTVETFNESWGTGGGYRITFKNNESPNESGEVLSSVEKIAETILLPKLYIKTDANITSGNSTAGSISRQNGYLVVDLQGIYDARTIEQGSTYSFELKANGTEFAVSDIQSIEMVKHTKIGGAEYGRQTIYGAVSENGNYAPVIRGVANKTIEVGTAFDPMDGVTATDDRDGNLTSSIQVEGSVDTSVAGTYRLVYTVTDSEGLTTTTSCVITVAEGGSTTPEPEQPDGTEYDPAKAYVQGDVVTYNGKTYVAKWWVQGGTPGTDSAWELVTGENSDGSVDYVPGAAYTLGTKVKYEGNVYEANWWTNTVPGSDSSWKLIS